MKQIFTAVCAAAFGAFVGSHFGQPPTTVRAAAGDKVETKELVLLDENSQPAARMMCLNNRAVLQFYAGDGNPALEVGVGRAGPERFIHLLGAKGRVLAALNSLPPNGETTLYLGDQRWESRVVLGALQTDMEPSKAVGVDDWGLQFLRAGSSEALFSVLVKSKGATPSWTGAISLLRENGQRWSVH